MRDRPLRIDRVTAEAAAELVVDAAVGHARERRAHDPQRFFVAGVRRRRAGRTRVRQHAETSARRRIRRARASNAARQRGERPCRCVEREDRLLPRCGLERLRARRPDACSARPVASPCWSIRVGDAGQQVEEARATRAARVLGEIGAREKRRTLRREEHRERPAADAAGQQCVRRLVDLVDVGSLLAIDLDVHEVRVHGGRHRRVLERLVRHHMTPVARGVADRQQDGLALVPGAGQRFFAPRIPVDGIAGVLPEVRAGGVDETVAHPRFYAVARGRRATTRRTPPARNRRRAAAAWSGETCVPAPYPSSAAPGPG